MKSWYKKCDVFLIIRCKRFHPKNPLYEKVKITTHKNAILESFIIVGSFDCDHTLRLYMIGKKWSGTNQIFNYNELKSCIRIHDPNLISYKVIRMNNQSPKKVLNFLAKWHPLCPSFGHPHFPFPHLKFPLICITRNYVKNLKTKHIKTHEGQRCYIWTYGAFITNLASHNLVMKIMQNLFIHNSYFFALILCI